MKESERKTWPAGVDVTVLVGARLGRLIVLARAGARAAPNARQSANWECRCDCGQIVVRTTDQLRRAQRLSCGCDRPKPIVRMPEYACWAAMRDRCTRPKNSHYRLYGGMGVTVCARWFDSFHAFLEDVGPRPSPKHTLDRYPDPNGNYEPGNVRWATPVEQSQNRRNTRLAVVGGTAMRVAEAALALGISEKAVLARLARGSLPKTTLGSDPLHALDSEAALAALVADRDRLTRRISQLLDQRDRIEVRIASLRSAQVAPGMDAFAKLGALSARQRGGGR